MGMEWAAGLSGWSSSQKGMKKLTSSSKEGVKRISKNICLPFGLKVRWNNMNISFLFNLD